MAFSRRLEALRGLLRAERLDALLVPQTDPHGSEYLSPCFERRAFLSGFTGSAGDALVDAEGGAWQWTDGRYWLQAESELAPGWELMKGGAAGEATLAAHLALRGTAASPIRVGVDASLVSPAQWDALAKSRTVDLVATERNLVDAVWGGDQPALPSGAIVSHPIEYAGATVDEKLEQLRAKLDPRASAVVISQLDAVAWLLNLRGADVPYSPIFLAHLYVGRARGDPIELFVDEAKLDARARAQLGAVVGLAVRPYDALLPRVAALSGRPRVVEGEGAEAGAGGGDPVQIDFASASAALRAALSTPPLDRACPTLLLKATKNAQERRGMRACHVRDGFAKTRFLFWLEDEVARRGAAGEAPLSECDAADELEALRAADPLFRGLSFPSISSADANGAVIHYSPTRASCAAITPDSLYLIDSGAQYLDGTTDVTRTVHMGTPSRHHVECFSRVLKGFIAVHRCVFPAGTVGSALDGLARAALWRSGLDFAHGVGHGVGSYLCVHEGPQSISSAPRGAGRPAAGFVAGMTISDEPGYYEDGAFGIRIENILLAREEATQHRWRGKSFLAFDSLTLVPLQRRMLDAELLGAEDVAFVNSYHAAVRAALAPQAEGDAAFLARLGAATAPL